jgi:YbbR domain-containing protein
MIAFLRHIFLDDFWLKLFSTALAVLIWLLVTFASQKEGNVKERVFTSVPVKLVSGSMDVRSFQVYPDRVDVRMKGNAKMIDNLQDSDIHARVDLTGVEAAHFLRKPVEVAAPAGVTLLDTAPQEVQINRGLNVLKETKTE